MTTETSTVPRSPDSSGGPWRRPADDRVPATDVLELLGDEYTRRILASLLERPRSGPALLERTDASRATVYRRLNALEDAGIVAAALRPDPDGHHRKEFRLAVERLDVRFDDDGISVRLHGDGE